MNEPRQQTGHLERRWLWALLVVGLYLFSTGLFRDRWAGYAFHPDEAKQVVALENYLHGTYVWYTGSLLYDGYPLGLMHVDEWLLRGLAPGARAVRTHLDGAAPDPWPGRRALRGLARGLRVVYGLLCVGLVYGLGRRLGWGGLASLGAAGLFTVAPLTWATTHAATGDLGVTLFTLAALNALAAWLQRPRPWRVFAFGVWVAFAFASKYQGALVGLAALTAGVVALWQRRLTWRAACAAAATSALGFAVGVCVAIPHLLWLPRQTWRDIRHNFVFLARYNAPEDFLARPFFERAGLGLVNNLPQVVSALGAGIVLCALWGALWTLLRPRRDAKAAPWLAARAGVFVYPLAALVLSLAGKSRVLPLHFAYLLPGLCLAALEPARRLWASGRRPRQWAAVLLLTLLAAGLYPVAARELYFWWRPDLVNTLSAFEHTVFKPGHEPRSRRAERAHEGVLRHFILERALVPTFRNRAAVVESPAAPFWREQGVPPAPTIPAPLDPHWIFASGPVLPRDDRALVAPADTRQDRTLVFTRRPDEVVLGLSGGGKPVRLELILGGEGTHIDLAPQSRTRISLAPRRWLRSPFGVGGIPAVYLVPLSVRARHGPAVVTLLEDPQAAAHFRYFAGERMTPPHWPTNRPLAERLAWLRQAAFAGGRDVPAPELHPRRPRLFLPGDEDLWLPAGAYRLTLEIDVLTATEIEVAWQDASNHTPPRSLLRSGPLEPGPHRLTTAFTKTFRPYAGRLLLTRPHGRARIHAWRLEPDYETLWAEIEAEIKTGRPPVWRRADAPPSASVPVSPPLGPVRFANGITLESLRLPATVQPGVPFPIHALVAPPGRASRRPGAYSLFIHLLDEAGQQQYALDLPLSACGSPFSPRPPAWRALPADLPPGTYTLHVGFWNGRTRQRLAIRQAPADRRQKKRRLDAGVLNVEQ